MTTLTAYYDLAVGPASFDFVNFGVQAKMAAARINATRIYFVLVPDASRPSGFRDKSKFFDDHEARWRLWNICIPACALLGASVTYALDWLQAKRIASEKGWKQWPDDWDRQSRKDRRHLVGDLVRRSRAGEAVPTLRASEHARRSVRRYFDALKAPVVTMTKRTTYLPTRNSNEEVWRKAKEYIQSKGYSVVEFGDTLTSLARGSGYGELNLDVRMACYELASLNLQSNNGASSLCWFSQTPYRMFGAGDEHWDKLFVQQGLPLGSSWPWALAQQKIVYGKETSDTMIREFDEWVSGTS